jgi:hypothetical protein
MKKLLIIAACLALTACAAITGPAATPQSAQASYVRACTAYGAAFEGALQLRVDGKLNQAQIDQVTLIDQQITPICTGALPADPTAATQQITAAITSLAILETVNKEGK